MKTRHIIVRTLEEAASVLAADRLPIQHRQGFERFPPSLRWLDMILGVEREEMLGMTLRRCCFSYTERGAPHDLVYCLDIARGPDRVVAFIAHSAAYRRWQKETSERAARFKWDVLSVFDRDLSFDAVVAASSQKALDEIAVALTLALPS